MRLFFDTSAMVALGNRSDGNHSKARRQLTEMPEVRFVTSDYILDEALTAWMRLGKTRAGLDYVARLLTSPRVELQIVDRPFFDAARERMAKYADQSLSFTDVTNILFVDQLTLDGLFTFDGDFHHVGYTVVPPRQYSEWRP